MDNRKKGIIAPRGGGMSSYLESAIDLFMVTPNPNQATPKQDLVGFSRLPASIICKVPE